jgi:hypothetical protein
MVPAKLRVVEEKDFGKLASLLTEGFPSRSLELWEKRFHSWWEKNPFWTPDIPIGWLLEDKNGNIVGFMGNIPVKFQVNGQESLASAGTSWYVKPEFQGSNSILILLAWLKQRNFQLFLSTTPNEKVQKMIPKLGFVQIDFPFNQTEYWDILNCGQALHLLIKRRLKPGVMTITFKIILLPIRLISRLILPLKKAKVQRLRCPEYTTSFCSACDASFTEFWERNKKEYTTTLFRDAETLSWLCSMEENQSRFIIKCIQKSDLAMAGYLLFDIVIEPQTRIKLMRLRDLFIPEPKEKAVLSMISASMSVAIKNDVAIIKYWAPNQEIENIFKKLFWFKKKCRYPYLYKFSGKVEANIKAGHEFIPSLIDPDRGLI